MSAPLIWILAPMLLAGLSFALSKHRRSGLLVGVIGLVGLAWLAHILPIGQTLVLGPVAVRFQDTLEILGRRFILGVNDSALLTLLYGITAFWLLSALLTRTTALFAPLALGMVALFVAALGVEPFLYAALLIELAVLVAIRLLAPSKAKPGQGVVRFLIFQTLALPFILFTGWMLTGIEAGVVDTAQTLRAGALLGLGFAFLLAVFPFHSWIPMIAEESDPQTAGFILVILPITVLLFAVDFLNQYGWLRDNPVVYTIFRLSGVIMVMTGGVSAAFQRHFGRLLGYGAILEIGFALLALGLQPGIQLFCLLLLPHALGLGVLAVVLALLRERYGTLQFNHLTGAGRSDLLLAGTWLLASLSVAGLPALAGFPARLPIYQQLVAQAGLMIIWVLLGSVGFLIGTLRGAAVLFSGETWQVGFPLPVLSYTLILIGASALLAVGLAPQWFFPAMLQVGQAYPALLP